MRGKAYYIEFMLCIMFLTRPVQAQYSGGIGEPNEPYQIATAEDLILLGESPEDYHKHFILTADIDLDPNLPGRKVFDRAVIAPDVTPIIEYYWFQDFSFNGIFDGNSYTISHLEIAGSSYLGLFGQLGSGAKILNLGLEGVNINGTGNYVGGLAGHSYGSIAASYSTGSIKSSGTYVGGLVGFIGNKIATSYSIGTVNGDKEVGGLVGKNSGIVSNCFWDIETSGLLESDGGVGLTTAEMMDPEFIGLNGLANDPNWILDPGKDYPRLAWENTPGELIPQPLIDWIDGEGTPDIPYQITNVDQLIRLNKTGVLADRNFILMNDLDLEGMSWFQAVIPSLSGSFNGNGFSIRHVSIQGGNHLGLIGILLGGSVTNLGLVNISIESTGNYIGGLVGENDSGTITHCYSSGSTSGDYAVGGMIGYNLGTVSQCYSTGEVNGGNEVGGLVGRNGISPFQVSAIRSSIYNCYSTANVTGNFCVGGLAGGSDSDVTGCYSTGIVNGSNYVGGLVGAGDSAGVNDSVWDVDTSGLTHSTGGVGLTTAELMDPEMLGLNGFGDDPNWVLDSGQDYPRLAWEGTPGQMIPEPVIDWLDGSGSPEDPFQIRSADQILLLHKSSLLWDTHFVLNADIDLDPNLPGRNVFGQAVIPVFKGTFVGNDHMILNLQIEGANNLGFFGKLTKGCVVRNLGLENVLVHGTGSNVGGLVGYNSSGRMLNCYSSGEICGNDYVGGVVGCSLKGALTQCYSTGSVDGKHAVGGLVGFTNGSLENNGNHVLNCYSTSTVSGIKGVGGLVGKIYCPSKIVDPCDLSPIYPWLTPWIPPVYVPCQVTNCYSTGLVSGSEDVGGLIGEIHGPWESFVPFEIDLWDIDINIDQEFIAWFPAPSYYYSRVVSSCFWDTQNSGQITSAGGTGKTTAEMQTANTFLEAGWDFVDETENGIDDVWWIDEGNDYPRLWWQYGRAFSLHPQDGAVDVPKPLILSWLPGGYGLQHDVYFGEDKEAVAIATIENSNIYRGRQEPEITTYDPGNLELENNYYWRVDEVNESDPNSLTKGHVWSFTTANFIVVDDFENYSAENPLSEHWNGWHFIPWDPGYTPFVAGNGTGAVVGYETTASGCEEIIIHGGRQSMPLSYDNDKQGFSKYSETGKILDYPRNWTEEDVAELSLWFIGILSNDAEPLYVAVSNAAGIPAVVVHPDSAAVQTTTWTEWVIPLQMIADQGINLTDVDRITIGIGTRGNMTIPGGQGKMYFDDIRLYRPRPTASQDFEANVP